MRDERENRESIWSIPPGRGTFYFKLFTLLSLALAGYVCWFMTTLDKLSPKDFVVEAGLYLAPGLITTAGFSLVVVQGWDYVVLFNRERRIRLDKAQKELEERGRQAALTQMKRILVGLENAQVLTPEQRADIEKRLSEDSSESQVDTDRDE